MDRDVPGRQCWHWRYLALNFVVQQAVKQVSLFNCQIARAESKLALPFLFLHIVEWAKFPKVKMTADMSEIVNEAILVHPLFQGYVFFSPSSGTRGNSGLFCLLNLHNILCVQFFS
jgi:hypothetical protein